MLDIAKKKSKSSAVQYNLHLSSSGEKTNKQTKDKEALADLQDSAKEIKSILAVVSSCILEDKLQGWIVHDDNLGHQNVAK